MPADDDLADIDRRERWADEAERRLDGLVTPIAAEEVHAAVLRRLRGQARCWCWG